MQILNLANLEKSDIKYSISRFPDGEVQITLGEFSHKDEVNVRCRITSAEDLFILMQVADILVRHGMYFSISIYYLMGMRMDRVMDFNRPFTLKMIVNILDSLGASDIAIFCPHSDACLDLFRKTSVAEIYSDEWEIFFSELNTVNRYQTMLPDAGAVKRYCGNGKPADSVLVGNKVRDIETGKIISIGISNPEALNGRHILLVDDLCDGGGTFCGLANAIRELNKDVKISIVVNHMVNPKGIENLSKVFDQVYFSNSYKDWSGWKAEYGKAVPALPENVTQIDII